MASGAVLRALNKKNGPQRLPRSNYGIQRKEVYGEWREHMISGKGTYDQVDGQSVSNVQALFLALSF